MKSVDQAKASDHPTISGRRLVIATVIFGTVVGSSAFLVRPYMRRARARQTFQSLKGKLAADGLSLAAEDKEAESIAEVLAERAELDEALRDKLDGLADALIKRRLSREMLLAMEPGFEEMREERRWKPFIERLMRSGVARYDAIIAGYHRDENAALALFHSAEATEMKVSYLRMTATAIEALEVPYKGGLIIARRADQVAEQQVKRLRDKSLDLFPKIEALVEREFRLRACLRLVLLACAMAREPEKARDLAKRSLDPITGKAFILESGPRLSRDGGDEKLSLRLPFAIPRQGD